ncbi:Hvo_1808 family surface protein [Haloarchaeobius sp. HRN-SO-5]|uniref:Hvo_1808 family surface protein n=1 Tax=Haloarchaeobius sp. HRN-SO-5 TaxID=3446118 RepID=UPI003EB87CAD
MRPLPTLLVALLVVLAGCGAVTGPSNTTAPATETTAATDGSQTATATGPGEGDASVAPADPDEDVLGWEDGYWYNESIDVDRSDGLNDSELDAVVARGMARVEEIRRLEFEKRVPVEILTRQEYVEQVESSNTTAANRLHQNVKWEAMFMVNESTDAIAVQNRNFAGGVGGFYSPTEERIVIVSDSETPEMNEITLSQELFHALQDQRFNVSDYNQSTQELHNARDGIIEGDGNYVDQLYQDRCDADWDCLLPQQQGGGAQPDIHIGLYQVSFQPYSDGVVFVQQLHQRGGWEAVNAVYENPPASTEQTIHPDLYEQDQPTDVTIEDTSSGEWEVLDLEGPVDHASFGEAGLFVMMWYPSFVETQESQSLQEVVVPYREHLNYDGQRLNQTDPFNYDHPVTAGWDGDRLLPYVTADSASTNETGYVWKFEWDTEDDAAEFVAGYEELLAHHGAEPVDGRPDTFRIADDEEFGDAYYVVQQGTTVVVVNAPTVEDLNGVRAGAGTSNASVSASPAVTGGA